MDLVSFVPGIGPTANFTPGASTPPPFNVSHVGCTDGTGPTTASNNMAEIYNRILLNIASTVSAAGIPIDNNNWTQLPQAVTALVNQGVASFTSSITTPPQFDNDGSIATTAFVQRALGNNRGFEVLTANRTVVAADAGKVFYLAASNIGITLDSPAGWIPGATVSFIVDSGVTGCYLALSAGTFIPSNMFQGGTSCWLLPRSQYSFAWSGFNFAPLNGGPLNALANYSFGDIGYIRYPDGYMMQWGRDITAINETTRSVTFGWAFPTACRSVMLTGRSDGSTITNNNVPQLVSFNTTSFTYLNQSIAEPTVSVQPNQGVYWFAVGN
jgi:hypothetical protein